MAEQYRIAEWKKGAKRIIFQLANIVKIVLLHFRERTWVFSQKTNFLEISLEIGKKLLIQIILRRYAEIPPMVFVFFILSISFINHNFLVYSIKALKEKGNMVNAVN